jgi:hypothetical protein
MPLAYHRSFPLKLAALHKYNRQSLPQSAEVAPLITSAVRPAGRSAGRGRDPAQRTSTVASQTTVASNGRSSVGCLYWM